MIEEAVQLGMKIMKLGSAAAVVSSRGKSRSITLVKQNFLAAPKLNFSLLVGVAVPCLSSSKVVLPTSSNQPLASSFVVILIKKCACAYFSLFFFRIDYMKLGNFTMMGDRRNRQAAFGAKTSASLHRRR